MTFCFNCRKVIFKQHWRKTLNGAGFWTCKTKGKS